MWMISFVSSEQSALLLNEIPIKLSRLLGSRFVFLSVIINFILEKSDLQIFYFPSLHFIFRWHLGFLNLLLPKQLYYDMKISYAFVFFPRIVIKFHTDVWPSFSVRARGMGWISIIDFTYFTHITPFTLIIVQPCIHFLITALIIKSVITFMSLLDAKEGPFSW